MNDCGPSQTRIFGNRNPSADGNPVAGYLEPDGFLVPVIADTCVPTVVTDPNLPGNPIIYANQAFVNFTGYAADEILGESCDFICGGANANPAVTAQVGEALRSNRDIVVDLQHVRKDGTPFRTTLFVTAVFDTRNRLIHHLASYVERGRAGLGEAGCTKSAEDPTARAKDWAQDLIEANKRLIEANYQLREAARMAEALRAEAESAQRALEAVLSSISDGFMTVDRNWRFTRVNAKAAAIAGMTPEAMIGRRVWDLFPDTVGTMLHRQANRAATKRVAVEFEYFCPRLDRWFEYRIYPSAEGLTILENDVTARKEGERRRRLLTAELQHRVKNNLALIRSLSTRTLRRAQSLEDFAETFEGRLHALAVAQTLLSRSAAEEVDLHELLSEELLPYDAREGDNLSIHGPVVLLKPKTAQLLGLVFHELATNAVKFGALTTGGRIEIGWTIEATKEGQLLNWSWVETGVPAVSRPADAEGGFGRDLVERGVPYQLGGTSHFEITGNGARYELRVPLTENVGKLRLTDLGPV